MRVKFTQTGEIVVQCRLAWLQGSDVAVEFIVSDTGIGVDRQKLDRLFEPFVQADSSMSRRYGGAGLGLAICRRLVKAMNGQISVSSEPGIGTKFTFTIRLKRDAAPPQPGVTHLGGRRVVVAEPNEVLRASIVRQLEEHGVDTVSCRDLAEVTAAAETGKSIHLIADGFEFSRRCGIRAEMATESNVPIILLVPLGVPASELPETLPNTWRRLPKPIQSAALIGALESVFCQPGRMAAPLRRIERPSLRTR